MPATRYLGDRCKGIFQSVEHKCGMESDIAIEWSHTLQCQQCACHNSLNRHYCRSCGGSLLALCDACQFLNGVGDGFCGGCGEACTAEIGPAELGPAEIQPGVAPQARAGLPAKKGTQAQRTPPIPTLSPRASLADRLRKLNLQSLQAAHSEVSSDSQSGGTHELRQDEIDDLFA